MLMDPFGFALESFDAIGRYRTEDNGNPIEARVEMYDGTVINGAEGMLDYLLRYERSYLRNVTQRMMTYALGRGMDYDDMPTVRKVQHRAAERGFGFQSLILSVVESEPFQYNIVANNVAVNNVVSEKATGENNVAAVVNLSE